MKSTSIFLGPVVTEKAMKLAEFGKHVFYVHQDATKGSIKSALAELYKVDALGVQIIKMPSKSRVRGKAGPQVKRKPRIKAIVTLKKGEKFDLLQTK